jgi:hypothetical protein
VFAGPLLVPGQGPRQLNRNGRCAPGAAGGHRKLRPALTIRRKNSFTLSDTSPSSSGSGHCFLPGLVAVVMHRQRWRLLGALPGQPPRGLGSNDDRAVGGHQAQRRPERVADSTRKSDVRYTFSVAAANASPRGQRSAIMASALRDLTGFCLVVDCLAPQCRRERTFTIDSLAACYDSGMTVSETLRRMRCSDGCGGRVQAAWLVTGPALNERVRPRRVALLGAEIRG